VRMDGRADGRRVAAAAARVDADGLEPWRRRPGLTRVIDGRGAAARLVEVVVADEDEILARGRTRGARGGLDVGLIDAHAPTVLQHRHRGDTREAARAEDLQPRGEVAVYDLDRALDDPRVELSARPAEADRNVGGDAVAGHDGVQEPRVSAVR